MRIAANSDAMQRKARSILVFGFLIKFSCVPFNETINSKLNSSPHHWNQLYSALQLYICEYKHTCHQVRYVLYQQTVSMVIGTDSPGTEHHQAIKCRARTETRLKITTRGHQRTLKFLATAIKTYAHNAPYEHHFTTTAIFMNSERKKNTLRDINSIVQQQFATTEHMKFYLEQF